MSAQRFPVSFTGPSRAMKVLGITPKNSFLDVGDDTVTVRMAWAFRASVPRSSVRRVHHDDRRVLGWGAHGWRGQWLINGSSANIVSIDIEPRVRANLLSVIPVSLDELRISVDRPDELIAALSADDQLVV